MKQLFFIRFALLCLINLFTEDAFGQRNKATHTYFKDFPAFNAKVKIVEAIDSSSHIMTLMHDGIEDTITNMLHQTEVSRVNIVFFDFINEEYFAALFYYAEMGMLIYVPLKKEKKNFTHRDRYCLYLNTSDDYTIPWKTYKHKILDIKNIIIYGNGEPDIHWVFDPRRGELIKKE